MSATIYCKYCHHNWKLGIEYDKHIRCCEYFYQQRRTPSPPEMTESGVPIPNMRQLYRYVQDLTYRLEKTEKELKKLKSEMSSRKKQEVLVWLNQPSQSPNMTFDEWTRNIKATELDMVKSINGDLMDGILSCLMPHLNTVREEENSVIPIRCFSQKPGAFYVYSSAINGNSPVTTEWRAMRPEQFTKLMNHILKSIRSEFRVWNTAQLSGLNQEYDQNFMDKMPRYVKKLNADVDKFAADIKKSMFSKLEENLMVIVDC